MAGPTLPTATWSWSWVGIRLRIIRWASRFAMEAQKNRKAKLVCIDPRFNRTAAVSDYYAQIRAGSDIAFLGGLIRYSLEQGLYHEDYVRLHTNAPFLVREDFGFADGLFSGWGPQEERYDKETWQYQLDSRGYAKTDPKLEHPNSVFQLMKTHYSRYTPEKVASICGCTPEEFLGVAEIICSSGKADRRGTILYALGWTQHSHSVQLIHAAAMLQLLLGNIGVPGGGVNAPARPLQHPGCHRSGCLEHASRIPQGSEVLSDLASEVQRRELAASSAPRRDELLVQYLEVHGEPAESLLRCFCHQGQ